MFIYVVYKVESGIILKINWDKKRYVSLCVYGYVYIFPLLIVSPLPESIYLCACRYAYLCTFICVYIRTRVSVLCSAAPLSLHVAKMSTDHVIEKPLESADLPPTSSGAAPSVF